MVLGFNNATNSANTSAPMEVDRIKGKSKGKGKPDQKGKAKGKSDEKGKGKSEKGKAGIATERVRTSGTVEKAMDGLRIRMISTTREKAKARTRESRSQTRGSAIGVERLATRPETVECVRLSRGLARMWFQYKTLIYFRAYAF
jgi:hypothetical protein